MEIIFSIAILWLLDHGDSILAGEVSEVLAEFSLCWRLSRAHVVPRGGLLARDESALSVVGCRTRDLATILSSSITLAKNACR